MPPTVDELHAGLRDLLLERLELEPVILGARIGMGGDLLARAIVRDTGGFTLDPVAGGGDRQLLVENLTREIIQSIQELPVEALAHAGRAAEQARVAVANHYGKDLGLALSAAAGGGTEDTIDEWTIARALGPEPQGTLLAVRDAHRLPNATLWELRDLSSAGMHLLLLTTPEHREQMHAREAPFYGMSSYLEMPTIPLPNWTARLSPDIHPELLGELLRQTRFRTAITLEILERHEQHPTPDLGSAWFYAVNSRKDEARAVLAISRGIHELAPRLLVALARDEAPYARTSERSDRIALALRRLRENDLVEQPEPRQWQIADPLLGAAIRCLQPGYVEIYPEISQPWN
jgi:hypothetical protein